MEIFVLLRNLVFCYLYIFFISTSEWKIIKEHTTLKTVILIFKYYLKTVDITKKFWPLPFKQMFKALNYLMIWWTSEKEKSIFPRDKIKYFVSKNFLQFHIKFCNVSWLRPLNLSVMINFIGQYFSNLRFNSKR